MRIFNTSFVYLFWLANKLKSNIQSSVWAQWWKLVCGYSDGHKYYTHVVCHHQMGISYLFWLANNKKIKYNLQDTSPKVVQAACSVNIAST